jgi:hypothetical protein
MRRHRDRRRAAVRAATFICVAVAAAATAAREKDGFDVDTARLPVIDVLTTRSGQWKLYDAGRDGALSRYVWTLDRNPRFVRVMVCKRAFTHEAGDGAEVELTPVTATVRHRGDRHRWQLGVAQGSCRVAQNIEPVEPHAQWLRQAVAEGRLPAYRRERSYRAQPGSHLEFGSRRGYDPTSLGGESSAKNYVGVTSPQGGEYKASRGFLHDADAAVVDAALHNEPLGRAWGGFTAYSWYSLAQPQGAVWSPVNHVTVDPQFPDREDRPWEIANAGQRVRPDIDSVRPAKGWGRDVSHLENTGFVHWILTEDPVAGLVVQRQTAYALASWYEWRRQRGDRSYHAYDEQQRGAYNTLSSLWKARDVSRRVASRGGHVIWRPARVEKMAADAIADLDTRRARPMFAARGGNGDAYARRIVGVPLSGIGPQTWKTTNGGELKMRGTSVFQAVQYGKEPLYLWTRAGNPTVKRWFETVARHLVVRTLHIGGARGIDRAENLRGSSMPVAPLDRIPYSNDVGWARWVKELPIKAGPTDRFDGASLHTLTQTKGALLLARAAGVKVPELDAALAKMDADWSRTAKPRYTNLDWPKHWAAPR